MIRSGLVSVTFRGLRPRRVVELANRAGLAAIEWGGDVHVPHGDTATAREVGAMTRNAGLAVSAYGAYYRAGESELRGLAFGAVLDTALALEAPLIRVWAGERSPADADAQYRARVVADTRRIAALAAAAGIRLACEYHSRTLTETLESATALMAAVAHDNLALHWQPPAQASPAECLASLTTVLPYLANLHVFHWVDAAGERQRRPLAEGRTDWMRYLRLAAGTGRPHDALIEFVADDDPACFLRDAAVLRECVANSTPRSRLA